MAARRSLGTSADVAAEGTLGSVPGRHLDLLRRFRRALARAARRVATAGQVLLSWLGAIPRYLGDRLFAMNDTEAYWRGWQITKTHGGLGRRYRDPQFGTLAECPKCRGACVTADLPCLPCLGTGRVTLGEVSWPWRPVGPVSRTTRASWPAWRPP